MRHATLRRRSQRGYAAILVAVMFPTLFLGVAAIAVDTSRWYVEMQLTQKAADAAAMAGVVFMPQDFTTATVKAKEVAKRNGYDDAADGIEVKVARGSRPSQLRVTISSRIGNRFGSTIAVPKQVITQTGLADYTGPAPMGSPCNTFGNEPPAGGGASSPTPKGSGSSALPTPPFPNCLNNPQFWADIEAPETGKQQGDRYSTLECEKTSSVPVVDGCSGDTNTEYRPEGYFFVVKVLQAAVGTSISLQLYDPAFVNTGQQCTALPSASSFDDNMNPFVSADGKNRYGSGSGRTTPSYCPGDNWPGGGSGASPKHAFATSFALRQQTDSLDPLSAPVQTGSDGKPCIKQYGTFTTGSSLPTYNDLKSGTTSYNEQLAKVFHNWVQFCTFTPSRSGDYYLQVRTNVKLGGTPESNTNSKPALVHSGNTKAVRAAGDTSSGEGSNSFAMRAVTTAGKEKSVAVAGYDRMPIFENGVGSAATFNLIQVLPGAAGQQVAYSFFDVAEGSSGAGTVKVLPPLDATGSVKSSSGITGCSSSFGGGPRTPLPAGCSVSVGTANNGRLQEIVIPIPNDYSCAFNDSAGQPDMGGCWFRVQVSFGSSSTVNDTTTWDAQIIGDPVRLIE